MTIKDIEHLEWIHGRMKDVHKENKNVDYMLKFQEIIDELKNTVIKSRLRGVNFTAVCINEWYKKSAHKPDHKNTKFEDIVPEYFHININKT